MKTKMIKLLGLALLSVQLVSCGNNTDNLDVVSSTNIPVLESFFANNLTFNTLATIYTASTPYWVFDSGTYGAYNAPARGIVAEVGTSNVVTGSYVTIIHSARLATRVHGLQFFNVRSGDAVLAGTQVGTFFAGQRIAFQVLVDGNSLCPLSFLSSNFRGFFNLSTIFNPCK